MDAYGIANIALTAIFWAGIVSLSRQGCRAKAEVVAMRVEIREVFAEFRMGLKGDFAEMRAELKRDSAALRTNP